MPIRNLSSDGRREFIVYATPTGELLERCRAFYDAVADMATEAQSYPPHCTLTGFFHRTGPGATSAIAEVCRAITGAGPVPAGAVAVIDLSATSEWVGLRLRSPWLQELADAVAAAHRPRAGDDPIRLKHGLHLSLAYGVDDLSVHRELARSMFETTPPVTWEVALWERSAGPTWLRY